MFYAAFDFKLLYIQKSTPGSMGFANIFSCSVHSLSTIFLSSTEAFQIDVILVCFWVSCTRVLLEKNPWLFQYLESLGSLYFTTCCNHFFTTNNAFGEAMTLKSSEDLHENRHIDRTGILAILTQFHTVLLICQLTHSFVLYLATGSPMIAQTVLH